MAQVPKNGQLSQLQERFVREYCKDLNGRKSAIRAGYSPASAESMASSLLAQPKVSQAIAKLEAHRITRLDITADSTLRELQRVGMFDPRELFDERGQLRPVTEWSADAAACVTGFDMLRRTSENGTTEQVLRVRFADKVAALRVLAAHHGLAAENFGAGVVVVVGSGDVNGTLLPSAVSLSGAPMPTGHPHLIAAPSGP